MDILIGEKERQARLKAPAIIMTLALSAVFSVSCSRDRAGSQKPDVRQEKKKEPRDAGIKKEETKKYPEHLTEFPLTGRAVFPILNIFQKPDFESPRLGYMLQGRVVKAGDPDFTSEQCPEGWVELITGGYACRGRGISTTDNEKLPFLKYVPPEPDLDAALPYRYGMVNRDLTPIYKRIPADEERWTVPQPAVEDAGPPLKDGGTKKIKPPALILDRDVLLDAGVDVGRDAKKHPLVTRLVDRGNWLSIGKRERANGEFWYRTVNGDYIEAPGIYSRLRRGVKSVGVSLEPLYPERTAAFVVHRRGGIVYKADKAGKIKGILSRPRYPSAFVVDREKVKIGRRYFYRIEDGKYLLDKNVRIMETQRPPDDLMPGEKWILVDIESQIVTAYEGSTPVYAALAATGKDKEELRTPAGSFRIKSKHVSKAMDGEAMPEQDEDAYLIEDVPWAQFIRLSVALHGAFWHRNFGRPRSHGCINLAPDDARWLFKWSEPVLPRGWHGIFAVPENSGTIVVVREPPRDMEDSENSGNGAE